ncbi:MAG: ribbon-helix-helix domain-containing protein [Candidatus Bathyarchaeota archaeon]|nr:ribbon-helix-helix domain-containing protein [Candidatus Bathyarchaeota archaeon]
MRVLISVRIDEELRQRMRDTHINWSEYIREAIETKIREEMRRAADEMDRIAEATKGEWSGAAEIRKRRDAGAEES